MKIKLNPFLIGILFAMLHCKSPNTTTTPSEKSLIKVTIMYPNEEGKTFNMDYYKNSHMPMLQELFGEAMVRYEIDNGISGRTPEEPIPFLAIGYLYFEKLSDYQKAFGPNADQILGDIPNYTTIQPIVQISEEVR